MVLMHGRYTSPPLIGLKYINKYFSTQAMVSVVCNGSKGTIPSISNSGVAMDLVPLLGSLGYEMLNLAMVSKDFLKMDNRY
jgi:hypothetical protein